MTVYIIRHGQTDGNKAHAMQGRSDLPLNETGRRQAESAGEAFRRMGVSFARVYSSPLVRAAETARIVSGAEPELDDRLLEMDYGPYEGMDLKNPAPEVTAFFRDFVNVPAPEGMEQLSAVTARLGDFLEDLRQRGIEGDILIATHAIAMKGALEYLTPGSGGGYWAKNIANCAVYASELTRDGYSVPSEII